MKLSPTLQGNLAGIVASCLFGGAVVATRKAVGDFSPLNLALLRWLIGGVVLGAALALIRPGALRIPRAELPRIALLGLLLYGLFPLFFNTALTYTTASRGAVVLALMPLFTAIIGAWLGSERLTSRQWIGVALSIGGIGVVFAESGLGLEGGRDALAGNGLMVGAALMGAIYAVLAKPVFLRLGTAPVTAWAMLFGAAALLLPALVRDVTGQVSEAPNQSNLLVLYLAVPAGALGYFLISFALSRLSPTQTALYINLNPLFAIVLATLLLDESITWWFVAGLVIVIAGLILANMHSVRMRQTVTTSSDTPAADRAGPG